MKVLKFQAAILLFAASVNPAHVFAEAEIRFDDEMCDVTIWGEITASDAEEIVTSGCPKPWIILNNSPGGNVEAGMKIGRWARERQAITIVRKDGYCHSTCALVYIAGVERINDGVIGLHRPYLAGMPQAEAQIPTLVAAIREGVTEYVSSMGIGSDFANVMLETIPENTRLYHKEEIYELVAERDSAYDEIDVARNARYYGISTDEYRRRKQEASVQCDLNKFIDISSDVAPAVLWQNCASAVLWGLSQSVYLRRNESVVRLCKHHLSTQSTDQRDAEIQEFRITVMRGDRYDESR